MSTPRDLLNAAKAEIREIDPAEVAQRRGHYTLLDVREPDEYEQGAVPGAVHVARGNLEFSVEGRLPDKHAPIAVYCAGGVRSAFATKTLQDLGYTDVVSITGGFNKWKDEGLTWEVPRTMTQEQRIRYHRHLLLPEVGEA
ncbi:MAG: rhodanese-like domain-containing protein, partial [Acidimicrobiales bacterium]